ncbi:Mov34/MPN/PAD-1 family protein [Alicyclobacillus sp. SO9]|uniref:Mov34/MPN/PAD-1 family protein n=1 Tax=Alicyclobacillus sp. SO9 TaxID=2665646 RepID=UPI0018E77C6A|nr:Mov34/MPN/PAD-1 family protein [Alicyclobacillus sp. SO9]QQE77287.1 Mov34/MPN/PAD-1 family protein [Alicyclobacillus sp. SO9]
MIAFIRRIIEGLVGPSAVISTSPSQWRDLIADLNARSAGERESGAFLLGRIRDNGRRIIQDSVLYDDLDATALESGGIYLRSSAYPRLWAICRERNMSVVADVHTHPGAFVQQSSIDQEHPMISQRGHIAIVLPHYGRTPEDPRFAGIYRYIGSHQWETLQTGRGKAKAIHVRRQ